MALTRRKFLRSAGIGLALPCFSSLAKRIVAADNSNAIRRMVCVCAPLGLYAPNFFPQQSGTDYANTRYLELLKDFRREMTIISGLSHASTNPGFAHQATASFLTGAQGAGKPGFRNSIALDQWAAEHLGGKTRFSSLVMSGEGLGLSWTRTGAIVPASTSPSKLFSQLFLDGSPDELRAQYRRLEDGQSILDDVSDQAKEIRRSLGSADREKLDEYLSSVRALEEKIGSDEGWAKKPKSKVNVQPPIDISNPADLIGRTRLMFDLAHLALETDSTRLITIMLAGSTNAPPIEGVSLGHHDLSHHGKDPGKIAQLEIVEQETLKTLQGLLGKLKATHEEDGTLLDKTMVFFGSNLGDASSHSVKNLPVLICGGGFKHGSYLKFNESENVPLCNLYLNMLQRLGLEIDSFGTSTGTLSALQMVG